MWEVIIVAALEGCVSCILWWWGEGRGDKRVTREDFGDRVAIRVDDLDGVLVSGDRESVQTARFKSGARMAFSGVTRVGVLRGVIVVGELDEDGHGGVNRWTVV